MDINSIRYWNRYTNREEIEKVYGGKAVEFIYGPGLGKFLRPLVSHRVISKAYGFLQELDASARKVDSFIKEFHIKMEEFEEVSFKNFNEFFIRKFKEGVRSFESDSIIMPAFSEARYFGHKEMSDDVLLPVKGEKLRARDLLQDSHWGDVFEDGPFLIARLCPVDYHRYHYPDNGRTLDHYHLTGPLHSVNPLALKAKDDLLLLNDRRISILETENFGKLAYIEVGATCVGKIVQTFNEIHPFKRGDEKGYFLFGASTVIVLGEKGKWKPSSDILKNTARGMETYIHLGDHVAS